VRREASRHFRNKNKKYLTAKIEELETNSTIKIIRDMYRGINDFKKGYQPIFIIVKGEKNDLATDPTVFGQVEEPFSQLLNVTGVSDVWKIEIHTTEPLVLKSSAFEFKMANEKLKGYKSPIPYQIPAELIKAKVEKLAPKFTNLLILFRIRRNCLRSARCRSLCLSIRREMKQTVLILLAYRFLPNAYEILSNIL